MNKPLKLVLQSKRVPACRIYVNASYPERGGAEVRRIREQSSDGSAKRFERAHNDVVVASRKCGNRMIKNTEQEEDT